MKNHGSRIHFDRSKRDDAGIMKAALILIVITDEHVVGVVFAKAKRALGFFFQFFARFKTNIHTNKPSFFEFS